MSSRAAVDHAPALVAIRTRPRILELLEIARRDRSVLTLRDGAGSERNSAILSCDPDADLLRLDEPAGGWPDASGAVNLSVHAGGLRLRFQSCLHVAVCSIAVPAELTYREHRSHFRAHIPYSERAGIELGGARGNLRNLSTTGFGAWFDAQETRRLEADGEGEHEATLLFGSEPALRARVRIRHVERSGGPRVLIGGEFAALRPEDLRVLRRWSMAMERIALRRRQRLET